MVRQSMHWVQRNLTARFPKNLNSKRSSHDVPLSYFDPKLQGVSKCFLTTCFKAKIATTHVEVHSGQEPVAVTHSG